VNRRFFAFAFFYLLIAYLERQIISCAKHNC